jgi:hypothetical protein
VSVFRTGKSNLLPFGGVIDGDASTFIDRLFRPIVCCPGKWPRCDLALAVPCDGPAMYGAKLAHTFYHEHAQPSADPVVRRRIRGLVESCLVLKSELRRRALMASEIADGAPPENAREGADLIRHTFGEAAA